MEHIVNTHPRDSKNGEIKEFSFWDDTGNYSLFPFSKNYAPQISNLAQEIGIGPSMFLLTIKKLILYFTLLTIINIPLFFFYYGSSS